MTSVDIAVIIGGIGLIGVIWYYFFGTNKEVSKAMTKDRVQKATVIVDAAYVPDRVMVKKGLAVEITFDRRDKGDCTSQVVFDKMPTSENRPVSAQLAEGKQTTVRFTPTKAGEYQFVCGMGMVHGKLIVD